MKNQRGFSAVEGLLILVIVGLIGFTGWYVWQAKSNTEKTLNQASSTSSSSVTKTVKVKQTTPEQTLTLLSSAMKAKDKAKFEALISDEMKADAKANGVSSVYDSLSGNIIYSATFTQIDFSKYTPTTADYASKAGVKGGKKLTYSITTTSGDAKSTNVYSFSFVPKSSGWLLDDMSVDSSSSADINSQ